MSFPLAAVVFGDGRVNVLKKLMAMCKKSTHARLLVTSGARTLRRYPVDN